ncbi:MAG: type II toxin-antitoxin system RelE/ParE family toxin [Steroidobacteraceae bacterium]
MYTVRFRSAVYVLHCFQKKSPSGVRTAKHEVELIEKRLRDARVDYEERYGKGATKETTRSDGGRIRQRVCRPWSSRRRGTQDKGPARSGDQA